MFASTALRLIKDRNWSLFARRLRMRMRIARLRRTGQNPILYLCGKERLVCFPGSGDSVEYYLDPSLVEAREMDLLRQWLQPGDTVLDGGANLGTYSSLACAAVGPAGHVLACEPDTALAERVGRQAELLGHRALTVVTAALGATRGEAELWCAPHGEGTGYQSLRVPLSVSKTYTPRNVTVRTIDDILAEYTPGLAPSAVKLDIEGAEALALAGARGLLGSPDAPLWQIEIGLDTLRAFDALPADILQHFPHDQYEGWVFPKHIYGGVDAPPPHPLGDDETFAGAVYFNVVLIPRHGRFASRRGALSGLPASSAPDIAS